jgi:glutamate dehydrogenase (NAD(P)+)
VSIPRRCRGELQRLTRRYTSEIGIIIGPNKDIPAPDVNTDSQIMAWMMDTYSMNRAARRPAWSPASRSRWVAAWAAMTTGRGVFVVGRSRCQARHGHQDAKVAVQGFGNVGGIAARLFAEAGSKVVAVQDP